MRYSFVALLLARGSCVYSVLSPWFGGLGRLRWDYVLLRGGSGMYILLLGLVVCGDETAFGEAGMILVDEAVDSEFATEFATAITCFPIFAFHVSLPQSIPCTFLVYPRIRFTHNGNITSYIHPPTTRHPIPSPSPSPSLRQNPLWPFNKSPPLQASTHPPQPKTETDK